MLYIFEMANNHQGDVNHAKLIIDEFSSIAKSNNIKAGIKLQFRNLDTFIHPDFQKRNDLKYIKRFNDTKLTKKQFGEIVDYIKSKDLLTITTPFDNESIPLTEELNLDVLKVASCSVDDWPLLEEISDINKKIIISTAGADMTTLYKVYKLFKSKGRDFAFMHCVGEYPTPINSSNLDRIKELKSQFPDIEIGFSTHESPNQKSMTPYAVAMGCTIIEKHIGVETEEIQLNGYSLTSPQMDKVIKKVNELLDASTGYSNNESKALNSLKRGVFLKNNIAKGSIINKEDLYYAMPVQEGMVNASSFYDIIGKNATKDLKTNEGLYKKDFIDLKRQNIIDDILIKVKNQLIKANVTITPKDDIELSCHFGIENFYETGAVIVSKINRSYCKKIIVMLPNQSHPTHRHLIKEESFELLDGDCELTLNNKPLILQKGEPKLINTKVDHSFKTNKGCVIEEVSTTHIPGDSVYDNPKINKLSLNERKIKIAQL